MTTLATLSREAIAADALVKSFGNTPDLNHEAYRKASSVMSNAYLADISNGHKAVLSAAHDKQITDYLREHVALDQVLIPEEANMANLEPGITNDSLYERLWFRPQTGAYLSSFESLPESVREVFVPRLFLGFYLLQSNEFIINEYNALAYPFPLSQQIEESIGMDLQEATEWVLLSSLEECIQAGRGTHNNVLRGAAAQEDIATNGARGNGAVAGIYRGAVSKEDINSLKEYFAGSRSKAVTTLMTEVDHLGWNLLNASDFGDGLASEVFKDGYSYDRVVGMKIIRTIKCDVSRGDLFRPGNLYAFADTKEIGLSRTMRGIKFDLKHENQFVRFSARMARGHVWAVSKKVCKLELYNGGVGIGAGAFQRGITAYTGTRMPLYDTGIPGSDQIWGDPEFLTERDPYNIGAQLHRPRIDFA